MVYERITLGKNEKVQTNDQDIVNIPEVQGGNNQKSRLYIVSSYIGHKHVYVQKRVLIVVTKIMCKSDWPDIKCLELYQTFLFYSK